MLTSGGELSHDKRFTGVLSFLKFIPWTLAEFRHDKIVQSLHENYFNVCQQHKEKRGFMKTTIYVPQGETMLTYYSNFTINCRM